MTTNECKICLIEDDEIVGEALTTRFELEGYHFDWFKTAKAALISLKNKKYGVVISDIRLPDKTGEEIFNELINTGINLPPFIFITGYGAIDQAVRLLKAGAYDYLIKPFEVSTLLNKLRNLKACQQIANSNDSLGVSVAMQSIDEVLPKLANNSTTILITGESGVGKERVAIRLHQLATGDDKQPFIAVNCGALTESLLEAELFGYERGAFTGAIRRKKGLFEQADNGTLFLDEIGDMTPAMQVKVLRAIQERQITRVGGEKSIHVDVRLISATHRDLKQMTTAGEFREDLYYRINIINIKIPALRERKEDILWLAHIFLSEYIASHPEQNKVLTPQSEESLINYPWPGNVRELKHCIERACILSTSHVLTPDVLFDELPVMEYDEQLYASLNKYLVACEHKYILKSLRLHDWQIQETANFLGISRKNLWEKMRKLDIKRDQKNS